MKKRLRFLIGFTALILILCAAVTVICARSVTESVYYYDYMPELTVKGTHYTSQNDHVAMKDVTIGDGVVKAQFTPRSVGFDTVTVCTETSDPMRDGEVELKFFAGPFGTLFIFHPHLDFSGGLYVICLLLLLSAVIAAVLLHSFVDCIRRARFDYLPVICGGAGLFCLHWLAASVITLIDSFSMHYQYGFGNYLWELAGSAAAFSRSIAAVMAVFCTALVISNLSLIRHEGFRVQNLLGVILGVLWVSDTVVNRFFFEQSFDDVSLVFTALSNGIAVVISYFECMLFSTALSAFLAGRSQPPLDRDYVVILGCAIRGDGSLTPILRGRVDAALRFAEKQLNETGRQVKFVPSGGQGPDEVISEGEAMKRYLLEQGVGEERILPETQSVNTYQNIGFSKEIIENDARGDYRAAFATTNYHVFRGYILCKKLGLKNARGISAKTKWYFFPNAFLRELAGLVVDQWRLHIAVILLIILAFTALTYAAVQIGAVV